MLREYLTWRTKLRFVGSSSSSSPAGSINLPADICSTVTLSRVCARGAGSFGSLNSLEVVQRQTRRCSRAWPTARRQLSTASPLPISEKWWRRWRAAYRSSLSSTARAQESGLPPAEAKRAAQREAALLSRLRGVLCPSRKTAAAVGGYGVSPDRIAVVPPGTVKPKWYLRPRRGPVRALLCVANLLPGKGHGVLVEALAQLRDLDWNLLCVGSLKRDPSTARFVRRMILAAGLERRITLAGEWPPQSVAHAYRKADAFVLPSFHEGYGMVFAEAMAHGLPLIATAAGAIPETVSPEAALFVPPGDFGGSGAGASPGDLRACARRAARCGVTRGGRSPARMAESDGRVGKGIGSPYGSQSALARTLSEGEALNAALVELDPSRTGPVMTPASTYCTSSVTGRCQAPKILAVVRTLQTFDLESLYCLFAMLQRLAARCGVSTSRT